MQKEKNSDPEIPRSNALNTGLVDQGKLAEAYIESGNANYDRRDFNSALSDYLKAHEILEQSVPPPLDPMSMLRGSIAICFFQIGNKESAAYWALTALNSNRSDAMNQFNFGLIAYHCDLLDLAIEAFKACLAIDPAYPDAAIRLGVALRERFHLDEAAQVLSNFTQQNPHSAEGLFEFGNTLQLLNLGPSGRKDAMELYQRALEENPDPELERKIRSWLNDIGD